MKIARTIRILSLPAAMLFSIAACGDINRQIERAAFKGTGEGLGVRCLGWCNLIFLSGEQLDWGSVETFYESEYR